MMDLDAIAGTAAKGTLYGIGVGPGDVSYLTLRPRGRAVSGSTGSEPAAAVAELATVDELAAELMR